MLEWTGASDHPPKMRMLHDDAVGEDACGPAPGFPDARVGRFTPALDDEAQRRG
jgi:hypothetical protein